jgi:hypothetical protein
MRPIAIIQGRYNDSGIGPQTGGFRPINVASGRAVKGARKMSF